MRAKEIDNLLKAKPVDIDKVIDTLGELEDLRQEFDDAVAELTGQENIMPWEKGENQLQAPKLPDNWNKIVPQKSCDEKCEEKKAVEKKMEEKKAEPVLEPIPTGNEAG